MCSIPHQGEKNWVSTKFIKVRPREIFPASVSINRKWLKKAVPGKKKKNPHPYWKRTGNGKETTEEKMPREEITDRSIGKCLFFPSFQGQMKESMPSQEIPVTGLFTY